MLGYSRCRPLALTEIRCRWLTRTALGFTDNRGVDHVVEVGGAVTLARSFGAIRVGGKITMIGGLTGPATELNERILAKLLSA